MKKIILFLLFLLLSVILFATPLLPKAVAPPPAAPLCDESERGTIGMVPCGSKCKGLNNQPVECGSLNCHGINSFTGAMDPDRPLIPCTELFCRCELAHVFTLILNIYRFVIWKIAVPLAGLLIMIGGILLLVSGGGAVAVPGVAQGPNLYNTGKRIIIGAITGLLLIFGSWLIINLVLKAMGYQANWSVF